MLKRATISAAVGALIGGAIALAWWALGGPGAIVPVVVAVALVAWYSAWRARRTLPKRAREYALRHLDAGAGPPPGAEPADAPIAARWLAAVAAREFREAGELLSDDFRLVRPTGRAVGGRALLRSHRVLGGLSGDGPATIERSLADPAAADTYWLRLHRGGRFELTWWETWTLTPDHGRIRERRMIAFTRVA